MGSVPDDTLWYEQLAARRRVASDENVGELRVVHTLLTRLQEQGALKTSDEKMVRNCKRYVKRAIAALTGREGQT